MLEYITMSIKEHPPLHVPVLLEKCLELLNPTEGENYLDLTAGYGGHAGAILEKTKNYGDSCLVDRDQFAIGNLERFKERGVQIVHADFAQAAKQLTAEGKQFDILLLDLGVSSPQLDRADRGFSLKNSGPLDMRMDDRQTLTAEKVVNTWKRDELARIIREYGEESTRTAAKYAEAIVKNRPMHTTGELAAAILQAHRGAWSKIHPATRTFQAIRIAVNDELSQVEQVMPLIPALLKKGGRVGVISFHSLEDRIVKRYFAEQKESGYEAELEILTPHPVSGATDDVYNPRSRSAKLRVAVKK
jgi:16S rRNA (cytosine1402-N4)-methyltransferase